MWTPEGTEIQVRGNVLRRRYDDRELETIASRSSTISCECPRHLAELVMKLSAR